MPTTTRTARYGSSQAPTSLAGSPPNRSQSGTNPDPWNAWSREEALSLCAHSCCTHLPHACCQRAVASFTLNIVPKTCQTDCGGTPRSNRIEAAAGYLVGIRYPAAQERIPRTSPLIAPASQPSDNCACGALGRSPSHGRVENPNFWRIRATRSETFLRYASVA